MLGEPIFDSLHFLAPDAIGALIATEHGVLAVCAGALLLFDSDTGEVRSSVPIDEHFYRVSMRRAGERVVVGLLNGKILTCRLDSGALVDARVHDLGIDEEESYESALAAGEQIHVGLSSRRLVVDWDGTIVESIAGPVEGPENRVGIDSSGRAAWGDDSRVLCDGLELARGTAYNAPFAFDGDRLAVASLQYSRVKVALFDLSTQVTEPTMELEHYGIGDVAALIFAGPRLLLQSDRCIVVFDLERGDVAWSDSLNGPSGAMAVWEDTLFVARGRRVHRRSLATGERLDPHEGPSHPIVEIVGQGGDVLARDGHRVYVIRDGSVVGEHDAWSVHEVDGKLWMLRRNGTLVRWQGGRVAPKCALSIGNSGATMVEIRDREAIVPDPNEREAPKLVSITGDEITRIGDANGMRAWFFGDAFFVHHRKYDEHYERTQGFAVVDREGADRWRNVTEAKDLAVLGVDEDGRGFVIRCDGEAQLIDSNGEVVGSFGEFPRWIDAPAVLFSLGFVVLLKPNGELCRMPIGGGEHEIVHRFDEPPTAMWADASGRGLVAFGAGEIREIDLSEVLGARNALPTFPLDEVVATADAELADVIERTSFRGFEPAQHLEALRVRLEKLPLGDAHRALAAKLMARGARVLHRHGHDSAVVAFGLSPDGEHFAIGSWVGEDYERGGTLQVWSTRTGKVVKVIDPVRGGVGWPGYGHCLQWSPDGTEIGAAIDTNGIVSFPAFDEGSTARIVAYVTNGGNRPPHFTWSHSGDRFAISVWGDGLLSAYLVRTDAGVVNDQNQKWRAVSPDPSTALSEIHNAPRHVQFSDDDSLLMFANNHHEAWSVDVASGELRGFVPYQEPMGYSPDGRFFVHAGSATSVHATTGEVLQTGLTETDPDFVLWGPTHLVLHAGDSLHVFAPNETRLELVATLETSFGTSTRRFDFHDAELAEWSPDGTQLAFVQGTGRICVWTPSGGTASGGTASGGTASGGTASGGTASGGTASQSGEPAQTSFEVDPNVAGVLWRGELLIALSMSGCEVFDASADFVRVQRIDFSCKHEMLPDTPSPLEVDGEDLAASLRPGPTFPVGDAWGLAFSDGLVVCPDPDVVAEELSFVIDGHVLPAAWAIRVRSSVAEAADELPFSAEIRAKLGAWAPSVEDDTLPLGSEASLENVSELHWEIVQGLSERWQTHASEALQLFAAVHAHRGDGELAAREVRRIVDPAERVIAAADIAYRIASTHRELALALCAEAEERLGQSGQRQRQLASLAAAKHALGMPDAMALLAEAHDADWLKKEANPFQNHVWLARAYLRVGRADDAWKVLKAGPETHGMLPSFVERYIVHAARDGFIDHALRLANWYVEHCETSGTSFSVIDAISAALSEAGRHDEALAYLGQQQGHSTTMYEERVRAARGVDLAELLEHARLAAWPPDIARKMRDLTRQGAGQDVVATLLERLLEQMREAQMSRQSLPEMIESLAEALARVGMARSSDTLLQSFSSDQNRLALCRGVLRGSNDEYADARLAEACELARKAEPRARAEALIRIASALSEQRPEDSRSLIDEALESVAELRGDERRFGLSEITRVLLGVDEHEAAYRAWKKQSKANRGYEVQPLIESLARSGELGAALHVLRQLPRRDDMNGVAQHLRVLAEIYVHGDVVW